MAHLKRYGNAQVGRCGWLLIQRHDGGLCHLDRVACRVARASTCTPGNVLLCMNYAVLANIGEVRRRIETNVWCR